MPLNERERGGARVPKEEEEDIVLRAIDLRGNSRSFLDLCLVCLIFLFSFFFQQICAECVAERLHGPIVAWKRGD